MGVVTVSEPRAVATGPGYAGVPPALYKRYATEIKQAGRLRAQARPLAVLTHGEVTKTAR